jgi:hypothetical protein
LQLTWITVFHRILGPIVMILEMLPFVLSRKRTKPGETFMVTWMIRLSIGSILGVNIFLSLIYLCDVRYFSF